MKTLIVLSTKQSIRFTTSLKTWEDTSLKKHTKIRFHPRLSTQGLDSSYPKAAKKKKKHIKNIRHPSFRKDPISPPLM